MVDLRDVQTGLVVGRISEPQLRLLVDALEEEQAHDRDYYLDAATLDLLAGRGADAALLTVLREAMGSRAAIEVEWSRRDRA